MLIHRTELRVRYADTDQMGRVYNGKFFEYFEVGRTEMMREHNLPYKTIEANGYQMPVAEAHINYKSPAYYDEVLIIETRVEALPTVKVKIDHTIFSKERNEIVAEGYITLVFINMNTKRPSRPPEFFMNAIRKFY
ncbi:MAG: acyl-CoA thioesterase [Ignavibacteriales bacterium]|nr:acyl-CoA thioesterase [Ignavibacteriales bacterium]